MPARKPRQPLPGAGTDPVVTALDAMDERQAARHIESLATSRWVIGGLATGLVGVSLAAMFLVAESRGVDTTKAAGNALKMLGAADVVGEARADESPSSEVP